MKTMINWFAIPCSNFSRAVKFYSSIFEIEMPPTKDPMGNDMAFVFSPEEGIAGAINSDANLIPSVEGPRIYLNADGKLDAVVNRVATAGGEVIVPITPIDQWGSIAVIKDSEGNSIGLHSS